MYSRTSTAIFIKVFFWALKGRDNLIQRNEVTLHYILAPAGVIAMT